MKIINLTFVLLCSFFMVSAGCGRKSESEEVKKPESDVSVSKPIESVSGLSVVSSHVARVQAAVAEAEARGVDIKNTTIRSVKGSDKIEVRETAKLLPPKATIGSGLGNVEKEYVLILKEKSAVHRGKQRALAEARRAVQVREKEIKSSNQDYIQLVNDVERLTAELADKQKKRDAILTDDEQLEDLKVVMESVATEAHAARKDLYDEINKSKAEARSKAKKVERNSIATPEKPEFKLK